MGRESKFLLSLLGLLAGIFVTALALRLLIPRPPEGTGPDIHTMTFNPFSETVSPPDLTPRPENNSPQQETIVSDVEQKQQQFPNIEASFEPSYVQTQTNESPLPAIKLDTPPTLEPVNKTLSPDVQAPDVQAPDVQAPDVQAPDAEKFPNVEHQNAAPWQTEEAIQPFPEASTKSVDSVNSQLPLQPPPIANSLPQRSTTKPIKKLSPGMLYDVQEGDSWWQLAESAYGDGRYYRSLFAWNKTLQPRVSLSPGTTLEIPQMNQLQLAWPRLIPSK